MSMWTEIRHNILVQFSVLLYVVLAIWWLTIFQRGLTSGLENNIYTLAYPLLSLLGGVIGVISAQKWGGFRSQFGLGIYLFSFGLLAQFLGQLLYAYYIYIQGIQVPYPSLGDIGYFGSVILYAVAVLVFGRVIGAQVNFKSIGGKLQAFIIPACILVASYLYFLEGYSFDWSNWIKIVLDFGYPLGEALYVSLAIVLLLLSRNVLGGMMRNPMRLLIAALVVQYFCDFMFLYQANNGTWYVGGVNDFLYSTSYLLMTLVLTYILATYRRVQAS